ncbi:HEXXH motif-containing putative peptide modification protein [Nonomuraea sp. NPDC049486]|uniref:aKG-HExxH-type peptide beta-hydroxylase n=1 Tax=Nonomuraea sp. NPDC049486 TaxID=3155773 RepID=UPI00343BDAE0
MNRLVIPHHMFEALAAGHGGAAAGRFLADAARDRNLVLVKAAAGAEAIGDAFEALARMHETAPRQVDRLLRYPAVGAWALAASRALRDRDPIPQPSRPAVLAAVAALRARVPFETRVTARPGELMFPSLGRASIGGADCSIEITPEGGAITSSRSRVEIPADPARDGGGWLGLRRLTARHPLGDLHLVLDDLDPYRFPREGRLAGRLTAAEVAAWREVLQEAWEILRAGHARSADEIGTMISVMAPIAGGGWPASGTSRTTFGCVALARPSSAPNLAATLVHEVQHAKLTMLLHLVDLIAVDPGARYYAPWRHDPRPISGLLHGTYAHLGVAGFWRRQRQVDDSLTAHAEFARWRAAAASTARVIYDSSALTPVGRRFMEGMMATLRAFDDEEVPARAAELARQAADQHRRDFGRAGGEARV